MKKVLIISLITTSVLMLAGCGSKVENKKDENGKKIDTCPNCVFAYYEDEKTYGVNGSILTNYTNDYTTLKDEKNNQREVFLGHTINNENKIEKAYICIYNNDNPLCLEGTQDGSKFESNKKILNNYFDGKCNSDSSFVECNVSSHNFISINADGEVWFESSDTDLLCEIGSNSIVACSSTFEDLSDERK